MVPRTSSTVGMMELLRNGASIGIPEGSVTMGVELSKDSLMESMARNTMS